MELHPGYAAKGHHLISTTFMRAAFDRNQRREVQSNAHEILKQLDSLEEVSLVGTGMSGAMMLGVIADKCSCSCTLIRKVKGVSHSELAVEGETDFQRYIIVDDIIDSGATVERIQEEIRGVNPSATLEGILLYNECEDRFEDYEHRFDCWVRSI